MIKFQNVYANPKSAAILYDLLKERTPEQSISHKEIPNFAQHLAFFESKPYQKWNLIKNESNEVVGSIYLTKNKEIGIFIFTAYKGNGYGEAAVCKLMIENEGPFLANVNPSNRASIGLFEKLGGKLIQQTYEL